MISVRTYMLGDKRVFRRLDKIMHNAPLVPRRSIKELSRRTQISMTLRAPRDVGDLRKSITVRQVGQDRIEIMTGTGLDRPYDMYQDLGYKPHRVPVYKLKKTSVKFSSVIAGGRVKIVRVRKSKPFVIPTITEYLIPNAPKIVQQIWKHFEKETFGS